MDWLKPLEGGSWWTDPARTDEKRVAANREERAAMARRMHETMSYAEIGREFGVAKSTAQKWVVGRLKAKGQRKRKILD